MPVIICALSNDPKARTTFHQGVPTVWLCSPHGWRLGEGMQHLMPFHLESSPNAIPFIYVRPEMQPEATGTLKANIFSTCIIQ
jgi:hypothetical protein